MPDYDFSRLSPRSFERLIQALAIKILGADVVVFGDGPDGGREATHHGQVAYPSAAAGWNGYLVVQAKFRQRPQGPREDGKWAVAQLKHELKAFTAKDTRRQRPEYFIFATNVVLTPAAAVGGKDSMAKVFESYKSKLGLKGWAVWDFDQLGAFLDDNFEVRRTYRAWVTPGDVLATMIEDTRRPNFLQVMTNYLAKELLHDQFANLGQAGHAGDEKIPLARLFVDLPVVVKYLSPRVVEESGLLVSYLVDIARERIDFEAPQPTGLSLLGGASPKTGRFVLVGGPGQGKTTVGQFACQLFRAALLRDRAGELPAEVAQAISTICQQCESDGPPLPPVRRFPIRIVLSRFADALAREPELSALVYIARHIHDKTSYDVSTDDLREWLAVYPWFLVLDGLDEVPASTNRAALLSAISDLWVDAAQVKADLLVLATTRPQGYSEDFAPRYFQHLQLPPLKRDRAMHYAEKLVASRWERDSERTHNVLKHLANASTQEATALLMQSPLQITIMAMLVDQIGPPPQDRWRLFSSYYDVIYRREQARDLPAAAILREHRLDIDAIHRHVGLVLQLEGESAGSTEARMTTDRFAQIVTAHLEGEGHRGDSLRALAADISQAATHRLVFLVALREGQIGFEIRSLQEFMASEALMDGSGQEVPERLRGSHRSPAGATSFSSG